MKWFVIGAFIALVLLYNLICFAGATHDLETGEKFSGWERWKRFLLMGGLWPFTFGL
jgi:hypothetical protein